MVNDKIILYCKDGSVLQYRTYGALPVVMHCNEELVLGAHMAVRTAVDDYDEWVEDFKALPSQMVAAAYTVDEQGSHCEYLDNDMSNINYPNANTVASWYQEEDEDVLMDMMLNDYYPSIEGYNADIY